MVSSVLISAIGSPVAVQAAPDANARIPASVAGPVSADIVRAVGRNARPASGGGYNVQGAGGRMLHTHGPDPLPSQRGGSRALYDAVPTRPPVCVADPANDYHQKILYAFVTGEPNDSAAAIPEIRTIVQQLNHLLNVAALESSDSATTADYKVACVSGVIDVEVLETGDTSLAGIQAAAATAGFNRPKVDYSIFLDAPAVDYCGIGDFYTDETLSVNNANNNPTGAGPSYAVTHGRPGAPAGSGNCWPTTTPQHENGHNQGAVQGLDGPNAVGAPHSTGSGGHCSQDNDVMCYDDDGDPTTYPMTSDCATEKFDCEYDDYFDAAPESGEYLEIHWNIGSPLNRFIQFGVAVPEVRIAANVVVQESAGSAVVTVQRVGPSVAFDVDFETSPATTTAADFTDSDRTEALGTALHFNSDETAKSISVPIVNDLTREGAETISLALSNVRNATTTTTIDTTPRTIAIAASDQQPDGWIKLSGGTYRGNGIYNLTGSSQTMGTSAARGATKTFFVVLQNDGTVRNTFKLKGVNSSGTTIVVRDGATYITTSIRSSTGRSIALNAGATKVIRVDFKMGSSASGTEQFTMLGSWTGDRVIRDLVKGTVRVV